MKPTLYIFKNPFHGVQPVDGSNRTPGFDAYELSLCGHYSDHADGECRRIDSEADLQDPSLERTTWSIYGHTPERGVDHIMDAGSLDHALDILAGIGVVNAADIEATKNDQA